MRLALVFAVGIKHERIDWHQHFRLKLLEPVFSFMVLLRNFSSQGYL